MCSPYAPPQGTVCGRSDGVGTVCMARNTAAIASLSKVSWRPMRPRRFTTFRRRPHRMGMGTGTRITPDSSSSCWCVHGVVGRASSCRSRSGKTVSGNKAPKCSRASSASSFARCTASSASTNTSAASSTGAAGGTEEAGVSGRKLWGVPARGLGLNGFRIRRRLGGMGRWGGVAVGACVPPSPASGSAENERPSPLAIAPCCTATGAVPSCPIHIPGATSTPLFFADLNNTRSCWVSVSNVAMFTAAGMRFGVSLEEGSASRGCRTVPVLRRESR